MIANFQQNKHFVVVKRLESARVKSGMKKVIMKDLIPISF